MKNAIHHARIETVRDLTETLRAGRYTSIGSYPVFFMTADSGVLSFDAVRSELGQIARAVRDHPVDSRMPSDAAQWRVVACGVNWEDPELYCDHTGERIQSAYAEDLANGA